MKARPGLLVDITVRDIGRSDPLMVLRELAPADADWWVDTLQLEPGQVVHRREYFPSEVAQ